jgi:sarcosine oxidase delta subunit
MGNSNAFLKFVAEYSDEEILRRIDDPSDIDPGVYEAILITAKERQLISEEEFTDFIQSSDIPANANTLPETGEESESYWKCPGCHEIVEMEFDKCWNCQQERPVDIEHPVTGEIPENQDELFEAGKERYKYWKCPFCHESVDMEYEICWNCQKEKPINIEHPGTREMAEEMAGINSFNPVKTGFILIALGVIAFLLEYFIVPSHLHIHRIVMAGLIVMAGIVFVIIGITQNIKKK